MKFLINDIIFSGVSFAVVASLSVALYFDFNRKVEAGDIKQIGTITFKREVAQRKYQSQVVWEGVEQNFPVYNNDSIRTSDLSEAVIHLNDGTDINIEENSMIMLSTLENVININFEQGAISANRSGIQGSDIAAINIRSQDATVSIDKSNIQLTQLDNMELDLTVSDGTAKVKSNTGETLVKSNEKALISSDRKETKIIQLKFDLSDPTPNRYYVVDEGATEIGFSWDLTGNFRDITLEIGSERTFNRIVAARKALTGNSAKAALGDGVYYWRVSAVNNDTGKIEYSETGKFNVVKRKQVRLISPRNDEILQHSLSQNSVPFKWSEDDLANDYTLEISADKDFNTIYRTLNTGLKSITVDNFQPGKYYWRVRSNINIGNQQVNRFDSISSFDIETVKTVEPPLLLNPARNEKFDSEKVKDDGLVLSWNNNPSFISYEIEVARDPEFKNRIFGEGRKVNFAELKQELAAGKYYWIVKGIQNKEGDIAKSATGEFEITVKEKIVLISPAEDGEVEFGAKDSNRDVVFQWNRTTARGEYKLQISTKSDFSDAKTYNFKNKTTGSVRLDVTGDYYWRVVVTDNKNREVIGSGIRKLSVEAETYVPESGTYVIVKSPVKGGKIFINSKFIGYTEVKHEVKPDEVTAVRISADGYAVFNKEVKVARGETFTLSASMEKLKRLNRVKWVSALSAVISSAPVYDNNRIILCSENGSVIIMNRLGNVLLSKKIAKRFESRPVVYKNNIYIVDVDGNLYSVDSSTGKLNWQITAAGPLLFKSEPVVIDDRIYLATGFGVVESYDLNGKKLWDNDLEESIYNSLIVYKNNLIVATDAPVVYSLDAKDGDKNWSTEIDGRIITLAPLVNKNILYFGCYSGTFYAVSLEDGDVIWTYKTGSPIYSSPVVVDKNVYFGSENGHLYSLDSGTGKLKWEFKSSDPVTSSPIYAFKSIIVANERTIFSLNPVNGGILWQNTFESRIKTSPTFAGDTVILGLVNGEVVSVRNSIIEIAE